MVEVLLVVVAVVNVEIANTSLFVTEKKLKKPQVVAEAVFH